CRGRRLRNAVGSPAESGVDEPIQEGAEGGYPAVAADVVLACARNHAAERPVRRTGNGVGVLLGWNSSKEERTSWMISEPKRRTARRCGAPCGGGGQVQGGPPPRGPAHGSAPARGAP